MFNTKKDPSETFNSVQVYTAKDFDLNTYKEQLKTYLESNAKKEFCVDGDTDQLTVEVDISINQKKNNKEYTRYNITQEQDQIAIHCSKVKENTENQEQEIKAVNLQPVKDKFVKHAIALVNEQLDQGFLKEHLAQKMEYIAALSVLETNFLLYQLQPQEIVLVCLGITNLKSDQFETYKKSQYYFIATSFRNLIFESNSPAFQVYDITGQALELHEKIGKDTLTFSTGSFETELFNDTLFVQQQSIFNEIPQYRVEKYTDNLFATYNTKPNHLEVIQNLYAFQVDPEDQFRRQLKSLLLAQFPKKQCAKELIVKDPFFEVLYDQPELGNTLIQVMSDWQISELEQDSFLQLVLADQENFKLKHLAVFYDYAVAGMLTQKKPFKNDFEYRVKHLHYLWETKQYVKAIPFYEYVLEGLRDDSILELISDAKTDVLAGQDCNPIRIRLLEELSEIKTTLNLSNHQELLELAQLQPLVLERLTQLVAADINTEKVNTILSLFMNGVEQENNEDMDSSSDTYSKEDLYATVVPNCFKEAKGVMDSITNMIAQATPPDYDQVTTYSEKLNKDNYPEAFQILQDVATQLQMDLPECYIGNGDFAKGIIGVEASPNFIILGKSHIEQGNSNYFTQNELKANLAMELTHILFEHTRLTSKDVWRGAKNKGMNVAGVLLVALPVVSTIGNYAGKFIDITRYTKLFSGVEKMTDVVDKGQSALEFGNKVTEKFTDQKKESELLATSRLMEISADRVGLLTTEDLKSTIKVLLHHHTDFEIGDQTDLYQFLSQKNDKDEFNYQELIIRIKTLCSFYLRN